MPRPTSSLPTSARYYIYPYLNSTNLSAAYDGNDYGSTDFIPEGALDGTPQSRIPAGGAPGGNPALWDVLYTVSCTITNNGTVPGEEIAQVYVSLGGPNDPKVVLRNFDRLSIQPGQSARFEADITRRDLSNWDSAAQNWVITNYTKTVYVGASSRKLYLSQKLNGTFF
jgi:beta-glucosidase